MPRPTRLRSLRGDAGFRFERLSCSGMVGFSLLALDADEVANLPQHTGDLRALRALHGAADLAEPERAQRAAMPLALADLAAHLRNFQRLIRHRSSPAQTRPPARSPAPRRASLRRPGPAPAS